MAGWPLMSNGAVLGIIPRARPIQTSRGSEAVGIGVATIGRVGMTSTSKRLSASSYWRRTSNHF